MQRSDARDVACVAVCGSVLPCVVVCCSVLQCVAVCCSVLQCVAVWPDSLSQAPRVSAQFFRLSLWHKNESRNCFPCGVSVAAVHAREGGVRVRIQRAAGERSRRSGGN